MVCVCVWMESSTRRQQVMMVMMIMDSVADQLDIDMVVVSQEGEVGGLRRRYTALS